VNNKPCLALLYLCLAVASGLGLGTSVPAAGQDLPAAPAVEQQRQIDPGARRIDQIEQRFLTGDEDLMLLEEVDLFDASATTDVRFTTNAARGDDGDSDVFLTQDLRFGVSTLIDLTYNAYAEVGVSTTRYADFDELNSELAYLAAGASRAWRDDWLVSGDLLATFVQDEEWGGKIVNTLETRASVLRPTTLAQGWLLLPRGTVALALADPNDYSYADLTAGLTGVYAFDRALEFRGDVTLAYRYYFDYFQDLAAVDDDRQDLTLRVTAGLNWRLNDNVVLRASTGLNLQESTIDFLDYEEWNLGGGVRFEIAF
jgi:hypothetical protein